MWLYSQTQYMIGSLRDLIGKSDMSIRCTCRLVEGCQNFLPTFSLSPIKKSECAGKSGIVPQEESFISGRTWNYITLQYVSAS